jgi:twitching motility protein PilT
MNEPNVAEFSLPTNKRSRLAATIWASLQFARSFTDIIIHEGQPIRVKSAKGLISLSDLNIPGADLTPTCEDIQQFFASYLSDAGPRVSAYSYWEEKVLPAFKEQHAVNRSLRPQSRDIQSNLRFSILQHQGGKVAMVVRVTMPPPPLEQVDLNPIILQRIKDNPKGLLIITGPTASGKTATALSILNYLNDHSSGHIVTVEDPVEFPMENRGCVFTQREVGTDVANFGEGLRDAMRLAPDAILAGEIRDRDTAEAAILGGESGALMLVTTHGRSVTGTLRKILMLAGDASTVAMRNVLSGSLIGVIRQELLPLKTGDGYAMVHDTLLASDPVRKMIEEGNWAGLDTLCLRDDAKQGFTSMRGAVNRLVREGKVDMGIATQVVGLRQSPM